jgi:hypothetical protein
MIILKIKCIYLLYIYEPHVWYLILSNHFEVITHMLKYTESQYLSYLPCDMLSTVVCGRTSKSLETPALVKYVFSIMKNLWRGEWNRPQIKTVENELLLRINFKITCMKFHRLVTMKSDFLRHQLMTRNIHLKNCNSINNRNIKGKTILQLVFNIEFCTEMW